MLLDDVESYINHRPDSALATIRAIPVDIESSQALQARMALLHSIALDKCFIDLQNDSILAPAIAYYLRRGTPEQRMKTHYYAGRLAENAHNYKDALISFTRAEEMSGSSQDESFKGLISMAIANIYQVSFNRDREWEYREKGKQHFLHAGDSVRYYLAVGNQAILCQARNEWQRADSLFQTAIRHTTAQTVAQSIFLSNYAQMKVLQPKPDPSAALDLLNKKINLNQTQLSLEDYCVYSYALALQGRHEDANTMMDRLESAYGSTIEIIYWQYRMEMCRNNYEAAIQYLNQAYLNNDKVLERVLSESLPESLTQYYQDEAEREKQERVSLAQTSIIVLLILILLGTLVIFKQRAKRKTAEERLAVLQDFSEVLSKENDSVKNEQQQQIRMLQVQYAKSFKDQFNLLSNLCAAYWSPVRKSERDKIYDEVEHLLTVINNPSKQQELENMLNNRLDDIMLKIRRDFPAFREQDYRLIAYSLLGFHSKTIAAILGYTDTSVNTLKSRIRRMIADSNSENREFFLLYL